MIEITEIKTNKKFLIKSNKVIKGLSIITIIKDNSKQILKRNKYKMKEMK